MKTTYYIPDNDYGASCDEAIDKDLYTRGYKEGSTAVAQNPLHTISPFVNLGDKHPYNCGFRDGIRIQQYRIQQALRRNDLIQIRLALQSKVLTKEY